MIERIIAVPEREITSTTSPQVVGAPIAELE
jgi:hypothetical protein